MADNRFHPVRPPKNGRGGIERRSIWERITDLKSPTAALFAVDMVSHADTSAGSTTFRIDASGELVEDSAAALAASFDVDQPLGLLDQQGAEMYHLLALPADAAGAEVEALAVSVWDEAGWNHPGQLHLTRGVTLEGPWSVAGDTREALGLSSKISTVWRLRCPAIRGAKPPPEIIQIDEWAQAFPDGVAVGVEYTALQALRKFARRLGGELRIAGEGKIILPDPDSAVNLQVYTNRYLPSHQLKDTLDRFFWEVSLSGPAQQPAEGEPYALLLPRGSRSRILVGIRRVDRVPRVLRWEPWAQGPVYLIEIQWVNAVQMESVGGQLTRLGRLERARVSTTVGMVATLIAEMVENSAVIDEDEFVLGFDELPPAEAEPRP